MLSILVSIVAAPFLGAALTLGLPPRWGGRIALLPPSIALVLALLRWPTASAVTLVAVPWIPAANITADLVWDRRGAFFVVLVAAIGLGVVQYSRAYLGAKGTPRYWAALLAFMGAMLGIVVSDSLLLLFVFWELTTINSALLIAFDPTDPEARAGAIRAFLVTDAGGLALLAGVLLLGHRTGTYDVSELAARADEIVSSSGHVLPLCLVLIGAFAKSAQFPFHFWLPGAMAAPAPVSAYLHSATMVKAGIFLMGRLYPVFHASPVWQPLLVTVGLSTFVLAGWDAVRAWDLKKLLAFSTVAYLGVLTALHGLYPRVGARGELLNIVNHALYKSALFLLVGWMEKVTGTRDLSVLRDEHWFRREPVAGVLIGVGALAMAGFPLVLGFLSKEILFEALLAGRGALAVVALGAAIIGGAFAVTYALKLFVSTFWGPEVPPAERGHPPGEISRWLLIVPALLLAPQVAGGLAPGWVLGAIVEPEPGWPPALAVWHALDMLFGLSVITIVVGLLGYLAWRRIAEPPGTPETQIIADRVSALVLDAASRLSRAVQAGGQPRYLAITLVVALGTAAAALARHGGLPAADAWGPDLDRAWLPASVIAVGAVATLLVPGRVAKVAAMAMAGYGVALFYVVFRAPDLVLTQILVETITLVLLLLVFRGLPELGRDARRPLVRLAHAAIAAAVAIAAAAIAAAAGMHRPADTAGAEQLALSLPAAEGKNAVNVILVDFRGADTLGEITVLVIAAVSVTAILRARLARGLEREERG